MKLTTKQIESFSQLSVAEMVHHLRDDFTKQRAIHGIEERDLEPLIVRGIDDAKRYGVVHKADVEFYLECLAMLGPGFDRDKEIPWAGEILGRNDLDGSAKMEEIRQHIIYVLGQPG